MTEDVIVQAAGKQWKVEPRAGAGDAPHEAAATPGESETVVAEAVDGSERRSLHIPRDASISQIAAAIEAGAPDQP